MGTHIDVHIYIYIYIYTRTGGYNCVRIQRYVYICMYIYVYIDTVQFRYVSRIPKMMGR